MCRVLLVFRRYFGFGGWFGSCAFDDQDFDLIGHVGLGILRGTSCGDVKDFGNVGVAGSGVGVVVGL
jgi:hypothetical protein